jgi:hypothetical protein
LVYAPPAASHAPHVNADSVGTAGSPPVSPKYHAATASADAGAALEKEDHVKSDCTPFQADTGDVLSHTMANPAALVLPQYDPVCESASDPAKAMVCTCPKLASANVTVHALRQLLRQLAGKPSHTDTPFTQRPVTLLSTVNVHVTQCPS